MDCENGKTSSNSRAKTLVSAPNPCTEEDKVVSRNGFPACSWCSHGYVVRMRNSGTRQNTVATCSVDSRLGSMRKLWLMLALVALTGFVHIVFILVYPSLREVATGSFIGLHGLRLAASSTLPPLTGATRHYKSLLDNQTISLSCSSCALVSNSGFLLGKGAGKDIDRQSCVFRMNMAPVEGYEGDVGTRTTLRVMNFFMFKVTPEALPPGSRVMIWGLFPREPHLKRALNMTKRLTAGSTIYGQTLEGEVEAEELFAKETGLPLRKTNSWLSTGWFSMMIAFDLCQEIHLYGMVPSDFCSNKTKTDVLYHYYDPKSRTQCSTYDRAETNKEGAHRFMTEKAVFGRWALRYNITFHYPNWTPDQKLLRKLDTPFVNSLG